MKWGYFFIKKMILIDEIVLLINVLCGGHSELEQLKKENVALFAQLKAFKLT